MNQLIDIYNKLIINIPNISFDHLIASILIVAWAIVIGFIGFFILILLNSDLKFHGELRAFKKEFRLNKQYKEKNNFWLISNVLFNLLFVYITYIYIMGLFNGKLNIPLVIIHILMLISIFVNFEKRIYFTDYLSYITLVEKTKHLNSLLGTPELESFRRGLMVINLEKEVRNDFYLFNLYLKSNLTKYQEFSDELGHDVDRKLVEDIQLILDLPQRIFVSENVSDTDVYKLLKFYKTNLVKDVHNTFNLHNLMSIKANESLYTTLKDSLENTVELSRKSELLNSDYISKVGNDYVVRRR